MPLRLAILLALAPLPALAHHPMGGAVPSTAWEGFASGVGHPVIGLDHLAFLLAAGVLAATLGTGRGAVAILAFVAGGFLGSLAHVAGIGFGPVEALVALSLVAAGLALLWRGVPAALVPAGFALAGLVHGHAFAEAVIGAEATPILAYLLALALTQAAIGLGTMLAARRIGADAPRLRIPAGTAATLAGVVFLAMAA
ncbi:HupE/UreJ family protein [Roseomonas rosulenta]|uniref:HupE/UreJ family protein n=1 Tax=Roseomonas rosulenta TaxID=2748667 RepID=UPI0018E06184|nr:HupE/UreJ family protein [Roseomonas rosulenta]